MRVFSLILSLIAFLAVAGGGAAQAAVVPVPGPNPTWSEMQKFEWHLGYMARAARTCRSHDDAAVLERLARMSPYGTMGLGGYSGDGFLGAACARLNERASELVADAQNIEDYIEATYNCADEACYGQKFVAWKSHECADDLMVHLSKHDLTEHDLREVSIRDAVVGANRQISARVRLKSCEGSLYLEFSQSCRIVKNYTRGDCEVAGVAGY